jgi:hypothetical protein
MLNKYKSELIVRSKFLQNKRYMLRSINNQKKEDDKNI